jgi:hypothetical protein
LILETKIICPVFTSLSLARILIGRGVFTRVVPVSLRATGGVLLEPVIGMTVGLFDPVLFGSFEYHVSISSAVNVA